MRTTHTPLSAKPLGNCPAHQSTLAAAVILRLAALLMTAGVQTARNKGLQTVSLLYQQSYKETGKSDIMPCFNFLTKSKFLQLSLFLWKLIDTLNNRNTGENVLKRATYHQQHMHLCMCGMHIAQSPLWVSSCCQSATKTVLMGSAPFRLSENSQAIKPGQGDLYFLAEICHNMFFKTDFSEFSPWESKPREQC